MLAVIERHSLFRMIGWLPVGLMFYFASVWLGTEYPQWQLVCWKLGNACTFSWLGYWIARMISGRLQVWSQVNTVYEGQVYAARIIARAIIVFAVLMVANGL